MTKYLLAAQAWAYKSNHREPNDPYLQVKPGTLYGSLYERDVYVFKCEEQGFWQYKCIYSEEGWRTFHGPSIVASDRVGRPTPDDPPTYYSDDQIMNQLVRLSELNEQENPDIVAKL